VRDPQPGAGLRVVPARGAADVDGVTDAGSGTPLDERLRRLEAAARARARGERLVLPEARSPECEVCRTPEVLWGALCAACRARLTTGRAPSG
jgi:hypothetical protein